LDGDAIVSLVTVAAYREPHGAHIARATLEAEGIPAFVSGENLVGVNWLWSQALGGVRVRVPAELAERAVAILTEDRSADLDSTEEASLPLVAADVCPGCGSTAISPAPHERRSKALSLLVNIPFAYRRDYWRCEACGRTWHVRNPDHSALAVLGHFIGFLMYIAGLAHHLVFQSIPRTLRAFPSRRRSFHCWRCDHPYRGGDPTCSRCGTSLPDAVASAKLVVRGREYDDACSHCHTPYCRADYLARATTWRCSRCKNPLPREA